MAKFSPADAVFAGKRPPRWKRVARSDRSGTRLQQGKLAGGTAEHVSAQ